MAGTKKTLQTGFTRVWLAEGGSRFGVGYEYQDTMRPGAIRWPSGDPTKLEVPDPDAYNRFITVDTIPAEDQNAQLPVVNRFPLNRQSALMRIRDRNCTNDIQVHIGTCDDPRDFTQGWLTGKVVVLELANISDYSSDELGALQSSERAQVNETATFSAPRIYEVVRLGYGTTGAANIEGEVMGMAVCDRAQCSGLCGAGSDGCQKVFAVTLAIGSVGAGVGVAYSLDGGSTWANSDMDAGSGGAPTGIACVGSYVVVITNAGESHGYALRADIEAGTAVWVEVTGGYVAASGPNAISSVGATRTWLVGDGGYIYLMTGPAAAVEVQSAGGQTVENLLAVHALDTDNVLVGGANNVVLVSTTGGESWELITGPAVGDDITAVWMFTAERWLVGTGAGELYGTEDGGLTWTAVAFSGQGSGVVEDIRFSTSSVGYVSHTSAATVGRILRSIDAGVTWELESSVPDNDRLNSLAVCNNPNRVLVGGLSGASSDGVIVSGASAS